MTSGTILVVEDNREWQDSYRQWFGIKNHEVTVAEDKTAAFEHIAAARFDLAIVDINLTVSGGNQDGLEVVKHLKTDYPQTHVIVVSGSVTPEIAQELQQWQLDYIPRNELIYKDFITLVQQRIEQSHSSG